MQKPERRLATLVRLQPGTYRIEAFLLNRKDKRQLQIAEFKTIENYGGIRSSFKWSNSNIHATTTRHAAGYYRVGNSAWVSRELAWVGLV
jgi:hypothetical protein